MSGNGNDHDLRPHLNPGLHSVQRLEDVHLLQFSGHLLQMLESEKHGSSQLYSEANRKQKGRCF